MNWLQWDVKNAHHALNKLHSVLGGNPHLSQLVFSCSLWRWNCMIWSYLILSDSGPRLLVTSWVSHPAHKNSLALLADKGDVEKQTGKQQMFTGAQQPWLLLTAEGKSTMPRASWISWVYHTSAASALPDEGSGWMQTFSCSFSTALCGLPALCPQVSPPQD